MPPIKAKHVGIGAVAATLAALLISHWEGEDLIAKHLPFDRPGVITVCDGVTNYEWPWLKAGMKFTPAQCRKALKAMIPKYAAPLEKCIPGFYDMPPHRQAALISASYNLGPGTICTSTIGRNLRAGRVKDACNALLRFDLANGKALRGLQRRRQAERAWCLRED